MRLKLVFLVIYAVGFKTSWADPTARTYIFAASHYMFQGSALDSLGKHFDIIISHDPRRECNPDLRDSSMAWRRNTAPILLVYKDAMTLVGPGNPWNTPYGDTTQGGGMTVGGFWHFDSLLQQNYPADTFFMLATLGYTARYDTVVIGNDTIHRVHAGSGTQWQWRWAMDYGEPYWQNFYACTTKVQCLRNYNTLAYDNTYFDGVFLDNLLQFVNYLGYNMYPIQYTDPQTGIIDSVEFRNAVHAFAQISSTEYHNAQTPPGHSRQILGVANLNNTCRPPNYDSLWRRNMNVLDGGMEESFALQTFSFERWRKLIHEIAIAESLGKMCLMCKKVAGFDWEPEPPWAYPFGYTEFDSTDLIFGFASYLMAFDSLAHFYFTPDTAYHYTFICLAPILDIDIGKPMMQYQLRSDTLAYRYYEEAVVFANPCSLSSVTAGFSGDTLLKLDAKADVVSQVELFTLDHHEGAICLYPLNYFRSSGFEPSDRLCWEHYCLGAQGITNYDAKRVLGVPPNGVTPHSGDWMYEVHGQDESPDTSFVRFKVFPYDLLIEDSTYLSFWIYVEDAPGDSAPIGLDCLLKSGKRLSEWTKYGTILDQYGREINPADRKVPEGAWYQYVFTFNPAVNETIDHIEAVYFDTSSATGSFCAYFDDVAILDSFPITDCWHCEQFPTDPTNGDPNFYMNFVTQDDSVKLIIDPQGNGGEGAHWVAPTPGLRNNITDIPADSTTTVIWSQYDRAHSLILGLLVLDDQDQRRWLYYAKNASNHWYKEGWVDMGDTVRHYHTWEGFFRNVRDDYVVEYGSGAEPMSILELRLEHFARSEWVGDSGGTIGYCNAPHLTWT